VLQNLVFLLTVLLDLVFFLLCYRILCFSYCATESRVFLTVLQNLVLFLQLLQNLVFFLQLLQNRHLMVRVGGGWDTLEHYLIKHNPVLAIEHKRKSSIDFLNGDDVLDGKFLYMKSKYKSQT